MIPSFKSANSYYDFEQHVLRTARYVRDAEDDVFLATIVKQGETKVETLPAGAALWRAQLGCEWEPEYPDGEDIVDVPQPLPPQRMIPLEDRASEGRANPKGIPVLYCATHRDTALAEVRPWIGSYVSVGHFRVARELRIINFTTEDRPRLFLMGDIPPEDRDKAVWVAIDRAFARPVARTDDIGEYVATQVIAETCKVRGFDGIAYRSSLGEGHNIALFDIRAAHLVGCHLFEARKLYFKFNEITNPYFVKETAAGTIPRDP